MVIANITSLKGSFQLVFCLYLALNIYIFIMDSCYLVILFMDDLLITKFQVIYHLVSQLLPKCENITLLPGFLKSFSFGCSLENNSSYIPSSLIYRSYFCKPLDQSTGVHTTCTLLIWYLGEKYFLLQWCLPVVAVFDFSLCSSALRTTIAQVQCFSLIVTVYSITASKVNGARKDILLYILKPSARIGTQPNKSGD